MTVGGGQTMVGPLPSQLVNPMENGGCDGPERRRGEHQLP